MEQIGQPIDLQEQRQREAERVAGPHGLEKARIGRAAERRIGFTCFQKELFDLTAGFVVVEWRHKNEVVEG
jgi:hypothetical protein